MKCIARLTNKEEIKIVRRKGTIKEIKDLNEVPVSILELDSKMSLFAEAFIGVFLLPYEIECDDSEFKEHVIKVLEGYRERVVLEQAYDLYARLGPVLEVAKIAPAYFPISRLSLIWRVIGYRLKDVDFNDSHTIRDLNELYGKYLLDLFGANTSNEMVTLRPPKIREAFMSFMTSFKLSLQSGVQKIALRLSKKRYSTPEVVERPWSLLRIKEGEIAFSCPPPKSLIGGSCRSPSPLSESLVCDDGVEKVIVKDYYRPTTVKWIPATLASQMFGIRFRLGAKSRMATEMKYIPLIRRVVGSPRIFKVCIDYGQAYMVREYIEGRSLTESEEEGDWAKAGRILAEIHESGISLGDPNPGNFVIDKNGKLWIIDLEQARATAKDPRRLEAWDILVFLVYSSFLGIEKRYLKTALEEYSSERKSAWAEVRRVALRPQVWMSLGVVAPNLITAQKLIKQV